MAVFRAVVHPTDAAPDDFLFSVPRPCAALIHRAAFPADHALGESIFGAVAGSSRGSALVGRTPNGIPTGQLHLHRIEGFPVYDPLVMVLYQVHRELPGIFDYLPVDTVADIGFLG